VNAPPRPKEGVVSWNVTTVCNHQCSYCTQRNKADRGRTPRPGEEFLAAFGRLPGRWEVKLSGGEPFCHPDLTGIVEGLAGQGHRLSIVTNFSAPEHRLREFVVAAQGRVGVFACSLHLERICHEEALAAFISRAQWLAGFLGERADPDLPRPHLCVTSVATRSALPRFPELAERFRAAGITFKVQPEKQDRDVIGYSSEERSAILALGGHNLTGTIAPSFLGRLCWAGSRYFVLDDQGAAWRCYPARRFRSESLGLFTRDRFGLFDEARPCLYDYCNCTVPIARGMMPRDDEIFFPEVDV
jgi:hypothetical protein